MLKKILTFRIFKPNILGISKFNKKTKLPSNISILGTSKL